MVSILTTTAAAILTVVIILTIIALLVPFLMSDLYECYELHESANDFRHNTTENALADPINPQHYQGFSNGAQPIDILECLCFNLGNTVKYCIRAGRKDDRRQDLRKAEYYLQREIQREERKRKP